jgi:hypothetical protein
MDESDAGSICERFKVCEKSLAHFELCGHLRRADYLGS